MKRLTSDNAFEMNTHQLALNQVYIGKGGWTQYVEGPDCECGVCDLVRAVSETLGVELPILSDEALSDLMLDWLQYSAEEPEGVVAILYRALCAMAEVRDKLFRYEDTGLEPEDVDALQNREQGLAELLVNVSCGCTVSYTRLAELAQAEKGGRLVVLQPNDPLTLEELREMDGDKIYVHYIDGFYTDEDGAYFGKFEKLVRECNGKLTACELPLECYGKTWLAYRRKPEEGTK